MESPGEYHFQMGGLLYLALLEDAGRRCRLMWRLDAAAAYNLVEVFDTRNTDEWKAWAREFARKHSGGLPPSGT